MCLFWEREGWSASLLYVLHDLTWSSLFPTVVIQCCANQFEHYSSWPAGVVLKLVYICSNGRYNTYIRVLLNFITWLKIYLYVKTQSYHLSAYLIDHCISICSMIYVLQFTVVIHPPPTHNFFKLVERWFWSSFSSQTI